MVVKLPYHFSVQYMWDLLWKGVKQVVLIWLFVLRKEMVWVCCVGVAFYLICIAFVNLVSVHLSISLSPWFVFLCAGEIAPSWKFSSLVRLNTLVA